MNSYIVYLLLLILNIKFQVAPHIGYVMWCSESGLCCRNFVCLSISDIFVN